MGLFNRVLHRLLSSKEFEKAPQAEATSDRLLAQINQFASLIRLQDERKLVEVLVGKQGQSFQSMIVGVDLYNQQLIIDEFSPQIKNPQDLVGQAVILRHQNNQQMLKIESEVVKWDEGARTIMLNLPSKVDYQPRRQHKRTFISPIEPIKVTIDPIYGAPWYSNLDNISLGGARILVMGDLRSNLHKNKPLQKCDIRFNNGQTLSCRAKVKSYSYQGRPFRRTEISIEFESLSNENRLKLEEYIDQLSTV